MKSSSTDEVEVAAFKSILYEMQRHQRLQKKGKVAEVHEVSLYHWAGAVLDKGQNCHVARPSNVLCYLQ